uniref:Ww domain-containing isoform 1 n=1 Tax=Tetraselmis sp. GSL018 TaxID=582737 RepID=A0A061QH10_9CHLO
MGKKKGSSLQHKSSRRNRLVIFNGELDASEEDTENDPVAAAIRAKYERREAEVKAAARAAASAAAPDLTTWVWGMEDNESDPADAASPKNGKRHPLASLIGYSGHDSDEETAGGAWGPPPGRAPSPGGAAATAEGARLQADGSSNPDDKVASFIEELESDGLLREDEATEGEQEAQPGAAAESGGGEQRVLGPLDGHPDWRRVLDTGSGSVYFWNQSSNEVVWDNPLGSASVEAAPPEEQRQPPHSHGDGEGPEAEAPSASDNPLEQAGALSEDNASQAWRDCSEAIEAARSAVAVLERASAAWLGVLPGPVVAAIEARVRLRDIEAVAEATQQGGKTCEGTLSRLVAMMDVPTLEAEAAKVQAQPAEAQPAAADLSHPGGGPGPASMAEAEAEGSDGEDMDCEPLEPSVSAPPGVPSQAEAAAPSKAAMYAAAAAAEAPCFAASTAAAADFQYPHAASLAPPAFPVPFEAAYPTPIGSAGAAPPPAEPPPPLPDDPLPPPPPDDEAPPLPSADEPPPQPPPEDAPMPPKSFSAKEPEAAQPPVPSSSAITTSGSAAAELLSSRMSSPPETQTEDAPKASTSNRSSGPVIGAAPVMSARPQPEVANGKPSAGEGPKKEAKAPAAKKKSRKLPKAADKLLSKWQAVREAEREAEKIKEAAESELFDPEALERKRLREAEEWRLKQLATGEAAENANFQPLAGDWRQKVKRARREQQRDSTAAAAAAESSASGRPDLAELSRGLPPGWQAMWDKASHEVYYGNLRTGETTWDRPS